MLSFFCTLSISFKAYCKSDSVAALNPLFALQAWYQAQNTGTRNRCGMQVAIPILENMLHEGDLELSGEKPGLKMPGVSNGLSHGNDESAGVGMVDPIRAQQGKEGIINGKEHPNAPAANGPTAPTAWADSKVCLIAIYIAIRQACCCDSIFYMPMTEFRSRLGMLIVLDLKHGEELHVVLPCFMHALD